MLSLHVFQQMDSAITCLLQQPTKASLPCQPWAALCQCCECREGAARVAAQREPAPFHVAGCGHGRTGEKLSVLPLQQGRARRQRAAEATNASAVKPTAAPRPVLLALSAAAAGRRKEAGHPLAFPLSSQAPTTASTLSPAAQAVSTAWRAWTGCLPGTGLRGTARWGTCLAMGQEAAAAQRPTSAPPSKSGWRCGCMGAGAGEGLPYPAYAEPQSPEGRTMLGQQPPPLAK